MERIDAVSPRSRARITGLVYLVFFMTAISGEVFLQQAGMNGVSPNATAAGASDAIATLQSHQSLFQLGFALSLISIVCYVAVTALFYEMFRPVSRSLSLIAMLLSLMGQAVGAVASLFQLAPFVLTGGGGYLTVLDARQLQALAMMFLNLGAQASYIDLVFDGAFLLLIGFLIFKSTFLPRALGLLVAAAGLAWLTFLSPPLANRLSTLVEVLGVVAEVGLMLWLLVMGLNSERWTEQSAAATRTAAAPAPQ